MVKSNVFGDIISPKCPNIRFHKCYKYILDSKHTWKSRIQFVGFIILNGGEYRPILHSRSTLTKRHRCGKVVFKWVKTKKTPQNSILSSGSVDSARVFSNTSWFGELFSLLYCCGERVVSSVPMRQTPWWLEDGTQIDREKRNCWTVNNHRYFHTIFLLLSYCY